MKKIGESIKALRQAAGLTQKELGDKLGVSASAVGQFEKSDNMRTETAEKIAKALGVSYFTLLFYNPDPEEFIEEENIGLRSEIKAALFGSSEKEESTNRIALNNSYSKLNTLGKNEAVKRVEELTHIEVYTKKDDQNE